MAVIVVSKGEHAGRILGDFLGWQYLARVLAQSAASERKHSEERLNGGHRAGFGLKTLRRPNLMVRWLDGYSAERIQCPFACTAEASVKRQMKTNAL